MIAIRSSAVRSLLALAAVSALASCSKVNDMHDATMDMKDQTKKMGQTTEDMSDTTKRMEETTCKMYTALRQGNSKQSRDNDMHEIKDADDINEKLELAAKYMQGFEYQVWATSCASVTPRDISIDQAATELLTGIQPYTKDRSKVNATKQSSNYATLYAIAATLHRTNALQDAYLAGTKYKPLRPMDILIEGLRLNQAKNRGEIEESNLPAWARTVGKYTSDAQFVLRLRGNFLMAYGYAIADSDDYGNTPNTMAKLWRLATTKFFSKKWTPNLDRRDPTEIAERITASLVLAKETRDALVSLGIDPMVDETMMKLWKDADFSRLDLAGMEKGKGDDPARAKAIKNLISARDLLLAHGAGGSW